MNEMKIQLYIVKDESRIKPLSTIEVGVNLKITMSWNYLWSTIHIYFMQHLFFHLKIHPGIIWKQKKFIYIDVKLTTQNGR